MQSEVALFLQILVSTETGASSEASRHFVEEFGLSELLGTTAPVGVVRTIAQI